MEPLQILVGIGDSALLVCRAFCLIEEGWGGSTAILGSIKGLDKGPQITGNNLCLQEIIQLGVVVGKLTVPGPGVPPSLISGKLVANEIIQLS